MKAISVFRFGGPEELQLNEIERPKPGKGEILVKLAYAGVNFIDVYMRNGSYVRSHTYKTQLPMIVGLEGAGTVAELGDGVEEFSQGELVAYCLAVGSYAEYAAVPVWRVVKIPQHISLPVATALMLQGFTGH